MISLLPLAAAGAPALESTEAAVSVEAALLLVMVVCLAFMAKAIADLSRRVQELTATRGARGSGRATPGTIAAAARDGDGPDAATVAAITAAVYAACDRPVRIIAVDEATAGQSRNWALEGRRQIFTSHLVR